MKDDTVLSSLGGKEDGVMQELMIFKENSSCSKKLELR